MIASVIFSITLISHKLEEFRNKAFQPEDVVWLLQWLNNEIPELLQLALGEEN